MYALSAWSKDGILRFLKFVNTVEESEKLAAELRSNFGEAVVIRVELAC